MMPAVNLHWRRAQRTIGNSGIVASLLLGVGIAIAFWTSRLDHDNAQAHSLLAKRANEFLAKQPGNTAILTNRDSLAQFMDSFPQSTRNADDLAEIFASARRHQVLLLKGEYQLKVETGSPFIVYSATFPIRSGYAAVKEFAADVLRALPHASLDELRISREGAGTDVLEAVIRFTLIYRRP